VLVDFARPDADLSGYTVVVAPATQVLSAAAQQNLAAFVRDGGRLVASYQTGVLDERLHVLLGGYLGALRETFGIRIEEFAPPAEPSMSGGPVPALAIEGLGGGGATEWGEIVRTDTAEVLATFAGGMLDGLPAITRNRSGDGSAWYVATAPDDLGAVVDAVLEGAGVEQALAQPVDGVEAVRRGDRLFLLNHTDHAVEAGGHRLEAHGAVVATAG